MLVKVLLVLELWMLLESDRFLNPVLREFYKEKNAVMEWSWVTLKKV